MFCVPLVGRSDQNKPPARAATVRTTAAIQARLRKCGGNRIAERCGKPVRCQRDTPSVRGKGGDPQITQINADSALPMQASGTCARGQTLCARGRLLVRSIRFLRLSITFLPHAVSFLPQEERFLRGLIRRLVGVSGNSCAWSDDLCARQRAQSAWQTTPALDPGAPCGRQAAGALILATGAHG
jgi:hypothetical protein